ncbi:myo-inosose-2 dehydratase [Endobacter medicaginis]|uniref:Myo-inosose-2 dehydratase n=1 Tax=Endobacter medicaginis TaxID=1181271 RepID=A0A850NKG8_9PROT|nr:myo-inosose-2 dehydratase [Endobacter medicaginis]MBB3174514.1 myo-inosose-2 dehydratase [Endobacter medicaginis]MCX5476470.1 myo-inosose-2 dehydratase [Endobacter medicaginis]NVN29414.1 myo-inosose-2 dehydratase [Endobacter medicaginis]
MTVRIGSNPIGWSNDDLPELGGETPLATCLAEAREAGYEGMELGNKFPREPAALRAALEPFALACVSGWYSTALIERDAEAEYEAARAHVALLREMGCDVMIVCETTRSVHTDRATPLSRRPRMSEAEWAIFLPRLDAFARLLHARDGLRLAYHHHMGTVVQDGAEIDRMMQGTSEDVSLLLDTGHALWGGTDPAALARRWRGRIAHVHTKDVRPAIRAEAEAADLSFLDAVIAGVYTVPGDGSIDYDAVFAELPGYRGWVVVEAEQDPARANPLEYARKGHHHLTGVLERAGLK